MNVNAQKFQSQKGSVRKPSAWSNQRTTLPQSALAGCQLPQRGSRERLYHSSCRPETATLRAIFIAPTKARKILVFTIQRTTLPQSRPLGVPAPSEREPGGCVPFNVPLTNRNVAGDFHRPYESSETIRPRFPPQKRYRVGQGTAVWEPAECVTEKPGGPGHHRMGTRPKRN